MNSKIGKYGAVLTGICVLVFAISMILSLISKDNWNFLSYLSCMILAIGYVIFACSIYSLNKNDDKKSIGIIGVAFSIIYCVLIFIVYYAQCTTVNLNSNLSNEVISIIDFSKLGSLFFNYDLLGYGIMALSTFFLAFIVDTKDNKNKVLQKLLLIHGIFFPSCFIVPMFPIFNANTGNIVGTILLEIWCVYFLPICILGYNSFHNNEKK